MKFRSLERIMLATAVLLAGLTSCNQDDSPVNGQANQTKGELTGMTVKLQFQKMGTRTPSDPNAIADEQLINTVDIFVYSQGGALDSIKHLTSADFTNVSGSDTWVTAKRVRVEAGKKQVYVGINIPPAVVANMLNADSIQSAIVKMAAGAAYHTPGNFMMFSTVVATPDLVATDDPAYATANTVPVSVSRLASKAAIRKAKAITYSPASKNPVAGSSDFKFALDRDNTLAFLLPDNSGGRRIDPNWDTYKDADFIPNYRYIPGTNPPTTATGGVENIPSASWLDVADENLSADWTTYPQAYATENTSKNHTRYAVTRLIVRTIFLPDSVLSSNVGPNVATTAAQKGQTFYRLMDERSGLTVGQTPRPTMYSLDKTYFTSVPTGKTQSLAEEYYDLYLASLPAGGTDVFGSAEAMIDVYTGGYSYYEAFLSSKTSLTPGSIDTELYRNKFCQLNIVSVPQPGSCASDFDNKKDDPITKQTDMTADVVIEDWEIVPINTNLAP